MSAFIVSQKTITAICEGLRRYNIEIRNPEGICYRREDYPEDYKGYYAYLNDLGSTRLNPRTEYHKVGQALVDMNYKSVNYRYREENAPERFEPTFNYRESENVLGLMFQQEYTPQEIFLAIQCYEYQSCECPEYTESGIPAALGYLKDSICNDALTKLYGEHTGSRNL